MKESVKSVVVLTVICLIVAALLAATNLLTSPIITANQEAKAQASLLKVLPGATEFEELSLPANAPAVVTQLHRDKGGSGYALLISTTSQFSQAPQLFTLGVSTEGLITGIVITQYQETRDFGKTTYPATYVGQNSSLADVTLVAGVTYSSTAFREAVSQAMAMLVEEGLIPAADTTVTAFAQWKGDIQ